MAFNIFKTASDKPVIKINTTPVALLAYEKYQVDTSVSTGTDPDPAGDGSVPSLDYVAHNLADGAIDGQWVTISQQGTNAIRLDGKVEGSLDYFYQNRDNSRVTYEWSVAKDTWEAANVSGLSATAGGGTVDGAFSDSSQNALENRVITAKFNEFSITVVDGTGQVYDSPGMFALLPAANTVTKNTKYEITGLTVPDGTITSRFYMAKPEKQAAGADILFWREVLS